MHIAKIAALAALVAGCASMAAPPPVGTATASLGEEVRVSDLAVRPLRVEEDSRCPASVQCVHAGTVRLAVRLEEGGLRRETVLRLGVPERLGDGRFLRLAAVCPYPARPGPIPPRSYRFLFIANSDATPRPPEHRC